MPARNVSLTSHLEAFIDQSVSSGRYQNASEVVRDGLRLLEARRREDDLKLERLKSAIDLGLADVEAGRVLRVPIDNLRGFLAELGKTGTPQM